VYRVGGLCARILRVRGSTNSFMVSTYEQHGSHHTSHSEFHVHSFYFMSSSPNKPRPSNLIGRSTSSAWGEQPLNATRAELGPACRHATHKIPVRDSAREMMHSHATPAGSFLTAERRVEQLQQRIARPTCDIFFRSIVAPSREKGWLRWCRSPTPDTAVVPPPLVPPRRHDSPPPMCLSSVSRFRAAATQLSSQTVPSTFNLEQGTTSSSSAAPPSSSRRKPWHPL
jgi:hypothetical protein